MPFRILLFLVVLVIIVGWRKAVNRQKKEPLFSPFAPVEAQAAGSWTGIIMLAITAYLGWRSRRHAPFFGIAALAFVGPYLEATLLQIRGAVQSPMSKAHRPQSTVYSLQFTERKPHESTNPSIHQSTKPAVVRSPTVVLGIYGLVALYVAIFRLPLASFQILSPLGHDPVREADILSLAHVEGNLATPFHWGSYLAWRLHPAIKISMDGRYEAAYPESTFQLNNALFDVTGRDWDLLLRQYSVDFIILDLAQERLRPQDLKDRGYVLIWRTEGSSALLALEKHAAKLREVVNQLQPATINPLDATIPDAWWAK